MKTVKLLVLGTLVALAATPAVAATHQKSFGAEKAASVRETATLAAEKASQLADKASFMAKDVVAKIPSSALRAGKVAGYGSLTAFCGIGTLLFAKESLCELKKMGSSTKDFIKFKNAGYGVASANAKEASFSNARGLFINSSFTGLAGYMTLYFAQKTKEAYSAK